MNAKLQKLKEQIAMLDVMSRPNAKLSALKQLVTVIENEREAIDARLAKAVRDVDDEDKKEAPRMKQASDYALAIVREYGMQLAELRVLYHGHVWA